MSLARYDDCGCGAPKDLRAKRCRDCWGAKGPAIESVTCNVPDCEEHRTARGYCNLHYTQWKAGTPLRPRFAPRVTHCPQGHSYTDHAYVTKQGHRMCRVCLAARRAARYARVRGRTAEPVLRADIYRRDEGICQLCGLPIPENATGRLHLELDHIVPLSADGDHVAGNLRATHGYCNRTRHAGEWTLEKHARALLTLAPLLV